MTRLPAQRPATGAFVGSRTAVTGTRVGLGVSTLPAGSRQVSVRGNSYHYSGGRWFAAAAAGGYCVVRPPIGGIVGRPLPGGCWRFWHYNRWYWYYGGCYYGGYWGDYDDDDDDDDDDEPAPEPEPESEDVVPDPERYEVVAPPIGAMVPDLPEGAKPETVGGYTYFVYEGTWYKPLFHEGEARYEVVKPPEGAKPAEETPPEAPQAPEAPKTPETPKDSEPK